jgi:hypothetical protein
VGLRRDAATPARRAAAAAAAPPPRRAAAAPRAAAAAGARAASAPHCQPAAHSALQPQQQLARWRGARTIAIAAARARPGPASQHSTAPVLCAACLLGGLHAPDEEAAAAAAAATHWESER